MPGRARQVYFWVGKTAHPLYREQFRIVPDGFEYVPSHRDLTDLATFGPAVARRSTARGKLERQLKTLAVAALAGGGHVRRVSVDPPGGTSLIHSAQVLLKSPRLPYVVDFEDVHVFSLYQRIALERPWGKSRLLWALRDAGCRYLLPWTDTARRGFLAALDPSTRAELASKTVTVLPAIRPTANAPRRRGAGPLRILFVGVRFFEKGGPEAVEAVRRLRRTHQAELDLVSSVPDRWREELAGDDAFRIHPWLSPADVRKLYKQAHVLLFPTHIDTFGYVVLEAMAASMPVVAPDHHALPELVEDGVSGLLFDHENSLFLPDARPRYPLFAPPAAPRSFLRGLASPSDAYIDRITEQLTRVAEDPDEYERLSAGAIDSVTGGLFSIERRRQRLGDLYERALG